MKDIHSPIFDDLLARWQRARRSVLNQYLSDANLETSDEIEAFASLPETEQTKLLTTLFKKSFQLGESFSRYHGVSLELHDIENLLARASEVSPCFSRQSEFAADGVLQKRAPCEARLRPSAVPVCHYFREAFDGLVTGLSEEVKFSRHRSGVDALDECVDSLYLSSDSKLRFGEIPQTLTSTVQRLIAKFTRLKLELEIYGCSESTLFYTISKKREPLCGPAADMFHDLLKSEVKKEFPNFKFKDVSPAAVLVES